MSNFKTFTIALVVASLSECAEREAQTFWAQALLRPDDSCIVTALLGSQIDSIQLGLVDLSLNRTGYLGAVQVVNGLSRSEEITQKGAKDKALENNLISITGVTINYDVEGLQVALPSGFFQYTPMGVYPQEAAIVFVNLLPPPVLKVLRTEPFLVGDKPFINPVLSACYERDNTGEPTWKNVPLGGREIQILVRLRFEGSLHDSVEVISNELLFPIKVCMGCLVSPSLKDPIDVLTSLVNPELFGEDGLPTPEVAPCIFGQDNSSSVYACKDRDYLVDTSAAEWLAKCAADPTFPDKSDPEILAHLCRGPISLGLGCIDTTPNREFHLRVRYATERMGVYCASLEAESPTWVGQ